MQMMGFVLLVIGIAICFGAKKIVMGKLTLEEDEKEKEEFYMLIKGGIIAVRLTGGVVAILGFVFLL